MGAPAPASPRAAATYLMSRGGYTTMSGTSMAAPHAAGAAALYIARHGLTKTAAGVAAVCAAIRNSGWHSGHYACFCDWLYYDAVFDAFNAPLLNVADLLYWNDPTTLSITAPADASKVAGSTSVQGACSAPDGTRGTSFPIPVVLQNKAIHIGDLDRASAPSGNLWVATVWATVHDSSESPVANMKVYGTWSVGAGTVFETTDQDGRCTFINSPLSKRYGSLAFTVNAVTPPSDPIGLFYDPALNHDPDGDSYGTRIEWR